ncbi:hypothetical protein [Brevundimonas sp.]|uniref:hypothetical protein n=1 Tax=Brevundimonas sp. TaxID=1871086 RepID=UPI0035697745
MSRIRLIGWSAFAVCILGYGAALAAFVLYRLDRLEMSEALWIGGPAALLGEVGLWIAAGCLGWSMFKGRKAIIDRVLRRKPDAV